MPARNANDSGFEAPAPPPELVDVAALELAAAWFSVALADALSDSPLVVELQVIPKVNTADEILSAADLEYDSARGYNPKHPEVMRIHPKRQVPALVHGGYSTKPRFSSIWKSTTRAGAVAKPDPPASKRAGSNTSPMKSIFRTSFTS